MKILKPAKFNRRNYKKFKRECISLIAKGNEPILRELAEELYISIKEIVKACKKYNSIDAHFAKKDGESYEIPQYTQYALNLLDDLSDAKFCQVMVCYVPHTAFEIINQIIEQELYNSGGRALINQLVMQAMKNKDSILHREEDYFGLGHTKTFTRMVFGNTEFIESNHRPLQAWSCWKDENLELWKIKKYMEVLNVATKAYITSGWGKGHPSCLYCGFDQIVDISRHCCLKLEKINEDVIFESLHFKCLSRIEWGLKDIVRLVSDEGKIHKYEFDEKKYDYSQDWSIYGVVAKGIFGFLENLSTVRSKDKETRMLSISLWLDLYHSLHGSKAVLEIQKRLNVHVFEKIEENLKMGFYPALTRLIMHLVGLDHNESTAFKDKFFDLLKNHYENLCNFTTNHILRGSLKS